MDKKIGILLDYPTYSAIPRRKTGYEHIQLYNKAAKKLGLQPIFMSLQTTGKKSTYGYIYKSGSYRRLHCPIPKVIHNRSITLSSIWKKKIKLLTRSSIVFNQQNRFSKYRIYKLLSRHVPTQTYLPPTMKYSQSNLKKAMKKYESLFIKPTSGSVGEGVIKIKRKSEDLWKIYEKRGRKIKKSKKDTLRFLERKIGGQSYLIQETISLAQYKGRPYDLRVSVQRDGSGEWQVTGMVGKVAAPGRHVTNVAQGGKVKHCKELFKASGLPVKSTMRVLTRASLAIAAYLGHKLPHLADVGLDMGVNREGAVKFIEMNGRDQRITFKKAGMKKIFFKTYENPLKYGKYLLSKKR